MIAREQKQQQQQSYQQPGGECKKHRQPLVLFCNEEGCQTALCSACIVTKHKGHDIIDIDDKAESIKEEVKKVKAKSQEMKDIFTKQIRDLKEAEQKLKNDDSKTLDDLDRTRALLYQQLDDAIEDYKETVKTNQKECQKQIKESTKNLERSKAKLEGYSKLAEQVLDDSNPSNVITQSQFIIAQYQESAKVTDTKIKTSFKTISFLPVRLGNFKEEVVGKLSSNVENISMPGLMHGLMPVKATVVKSVYAPNGVSVACNEEGEIYTGVHENNKSYIKSFDIDGNERLCIALGNYYDYEVRGLTCANVNGQGIIIVTTEKSIQMRNYDTGQLIHSLDLGWEPGANVCMTPRNTILVGNWSGVSSSKVIEYQVNNLGIVETGKSLTLQVPRLCGLCHVVYDTRQLVIASSAIPSSIVAVDYHTGDVVWRIDNPTCEGQAIYPYGVSSDGEGHLFISDYNNGRVCMMTPDGKIHHTLLQHDDSVRHQAWISGQSKLVVRDLRYFHVCDVSYEKT